MPQVVRIGDVQCEIIDVGDVRNARPDIDVKEGRQGRIWLDANSHRLPQTWTVRTASIGAGRRPGPRYVLAQPPSDLPADEDT